MKFFKNNVIKFSVVFSILMVFGNAPLYALNSDKEPINPNKDYIALNNGDIIQGEIVKLLPNSFKIITGDGEIKIKNKDVVIVGFNQELTPAEKYRLGILDGKRYAENKGGNLAIGFFFSLVGTLIVYVTSEQIPGYQAMSGPNKAIVNDMDYVRGYEKGARQKSGGNALIGTGILVAAAIILGVIAEDSVDDFYYY